MVNCWGSDFHQEAGHIRDRDGSKVDVGWWEWEGNGKLVAYVGHEVGVVSMIGHTPFLMLLDYEANDLNRYTTVIGGGVHGEELLDLREWGRSPGLQ